MDWQALNETHWYRGFLFVTPVFLVLCALVFRHVPDERSHVVRIMVVYGLALASSLLSGVVATLESGAFPSYIRNISLLVAGICVIRILVVLFFQILLPRLGLRQPRILQDVVVALLVILWGLVRLHYAGVDLAGIITTSAVITAVIGFSLQDTLGNILGGLALQLDDSIRVGDWIEIDSTTGKVVEVGWRRTTIDRLGGHLVMIPNSVLVKNRFVVLGKDSTAYGMERRWLPFHVDFRESPTRVIEVVEKALAAAEIPHVGADPAPCCLLTELAGNPARYAVGYWLSNLAEMRSTDSSVRVHVYAALKRAGIALAVPSQNVLVTESKGKGRKLKEEEIEHRCTVLRGVDLFDSLTPEELRTLAGRLRPVIYVTGDTLVRQGAKANRLYIIIEGEVDVVVESEEHERAAVAHLGPGEFFGEYALMTGEPRTATVVARTDVECYCLDKMAFRDLIVSRPEIAEEISEVLARRREEREEALGTLRAHAAAASASTHHDVRARIRKFFGLST
jgi:small-conductance mechanosensitive channel/CRP-like cAMP-binding protein